MKRVMLVIVFPTAPLCLAQNYQINWWVLGSGGGHSQSSSYRLDGTVGQSSSPSYTLNAGFWLGDISREACQYVPGDANNNETFNGVDVTYSVNYLKGIGNPPLLSCDCPPHGMLYAAADANGNCQFNGVDVTYSVNYLKGLGASPLGCPDCRPAGLKPSGGTETH